jgi:hypothetical protein
LIIHGDFDNAPSLLAHTPEEAQLVRKAFLTQKFGGFVPDVWSVQLSGDHLSRERSAMLALNVVVQIRRREFKKTVPIQHGRALL